MNEKLVIVPQIQTGMKKALTLSFFAAALSCFIMATFVSPGLFFVPSIIFFFLWVWRNFYHKIEFEYTYYDGELRIAKIINKAKRKNMLAVNMEDVLAIAPRGDRSVYKYENDNALKYKDFTSGDKSAKVYELVFKGEKDMCRYEFEPDEEMLDAIRVKYPRTVVK